MDLKQGLEFGLALVEISFSWKAVVGHLERKAGAKMVRIEVLL
jgi:hypothetical protein